MNEKSKPHSMERIHSFSHYLSKKETRLINNLLIPLFSLIVLSNPSPPSNALQDHGKTN